MTAVRPDWVTGLPRPAANQGRSGTVELIHQPGERVRLLFRRMRAKVEAVRQLLEGELMLFQAAGYFRDLNAGPPGMEDVSWRQLAGSDDGEKLCRQVILWAEGELAVRHGPAEARSRAARLERELGDHVAAHGGVQLPPREGK